MKLSYVDASPKFCCTIAAVLALLAFAARANAIDAPAYKAQIDKARTHVAELLEYTADAESGSYDPDAERNALAAVRSALPETETNIRHFQRLTWSTLRPAFLDPELSTASDVAKVS